MFSRKISIGTAEIPKKQTQENFVLQFLRIHSTLRYLHSILFYINLHSKSIAQFLSLSICLYSFTSLSPTLSNRILTTSKERQIFHDSTVVPFLPLKCSRWCQICPQWCHVYLFFHSGAMSASDMFAVVSAFVLIFHCQNQQHRALYYQVIL